MVSAQALSHVLLDDEIKKLAIHYARQGCASSSLTTGESSISGSEWPFGVRSHILSEEGDRGSSGMTHGMAERGKKGGLRATHVRPMPEQANGTVQQSPRTSYVACTAA